MFCINLAFMIVCVPFWWQGVTSHWQHLLQSLLVDMCKGNLLLLNIDIRIFSVFRQELK